MIKIEFPGSTPYKAKGVPMSITSQAGKIAKVQNLIGKGVNWLKEGGQPQGTDIEENVTQRGEESDKAKVFHYWSVEYWMLTWRRLANYMIQNALKSTNKGEYLEQLSHSSRTQGTPDKDRNFPFSSFFIT